MNQPKKDGVKVMRGIHSVSTHELLKPQLHQFWGDCYQARCTKATADESTEFKQSQGGKDE